MATPIYRDYLVVPYKTGITDGTEAYYDFRIYDTEDNTGNIIYQGRAYNKGTVGTDEVKIYVNDVCASWFAHAFPFVWGAAEDVTEKIRNKFSLYFNKGGWYKADDWSFFWDWSYDGVYDRTDEATPWAPITGRLCNRQYFPLTNYKNAGGHATATVDGTTTTLKSWNYIGTSWQNCPNAWDGKDVTINFLNSADTVLGSFKFEVRSRCDVRYALYYVNAFGGWDTFLIEGKTEESRSNDFKNIDKDYVIEDFFWLQSPARSRKTIVNAVMMSWRLSTAFLTDDEASRMWHLLTSPLVLLSDMDEGKIYAVNIKNGDAPTKTYKNNDRHLVAYTIEVEQAIPTLRR